MATGPVERERGKGYALMMKSFASPADLRSTLNRLRHLTPDSERRWGTMTPNEMLCHLADSLRVSMGERSQDVRITLFSRTAMKWVALRVPLPWPKGFRTGRTVDPRRDGTRPAEFARDLAALEEITGRFVTKSASMSRPHPLFGDLSQAEWLRWAYLHTDHHLRQFGL